MYQPGEKVCREERRCSEWDDERGCMMAEESTKICWFTEELAYIENQDQGEGRQT